MKIKPDKYRYRSSDYKNSATAQKFKTTAALNIKIFTSTTWSATEHNLNCLKIKVQLTTVGIVRGCTAF